MQMFKSNAKAINQVNVSNLPPHLKASLVKHYEKLERFGLKELDVEAVAKANPFHPIHALI